MYTKAYRDEQALVNVRRNKATVPKFRKAEVEALVPPHLWEYSKVLWLYGLCVKIFRRSPHLQVWNAPSRMSVVFVKMMMRT